MRIDILRPVWRTRRGQVCAWAMMIDIDDLYVAVAPLTFDQPDSFVGLEIDNRIRSHPGHIPRYLGIGWLPGYGECSHDKDTPTLHLFNPSPSHLIHCPFR